RSTRTCRSSPTAPAGRRCCPASWTVRGCTGPSTPTGPGPPGPGATWARRSPSSSEGPRTMGYDAALVRELRAALAAAGDPQRAAGQQAYMRSTMPFHGLTSPEVDRAVRAAVRDRTPTDRQVWEATVRELWDGATHREQRYAALAVAGHRCARAWQDPEVLDLYGHLVRTGGWWDLVGRTATRLVGPVLLSRRAEVTPLMDEWALEDDLWLRRTAIL